jgi:hypothetical protein
MCAFVAGEWPPILSLATELDRAHLGASQALGLWGAAAVVEAFQGTSATWAGRLAALRDEAVGSQSRQDRTIWYALASLIAFGLGDLARAVELGRQGDPWELTGEGIIALTFATRAAIWLGDLHAATELFEMLSQRGDSGAWLTACRRALSGGIGALGGKRAQAEAQYAEAIAESRRLGTDTDLALTLMELRALVGPGHPEAAAMESDARAIIDRLGAVALRARLDAIDAVSPTAVVGVSGAAE